MNYRDYKKESDWDAENKILAYETFLQNQFSARMIQDDESFLIFDWIGKIQASSNIYTYRYDDIREDFASWRKDVENEIDFDSIPDLMFESDMNQLLSDILEYSDCGDYRIFTDEALHIIEKYDGDAFESGLLAAGQRISMRIYLWIVGFQMGVVQLGLA